jgi:hypothetical protein
MPVLFLPPDLKAAASIPGPIFLVVSISDFFCVKAIDHQRAPLKDRPPSSPLVFRDRSRSVPFYFKVLACPQPCRALKYAVPIGIIRRVL